MDKMERTRVSRLFYKKGGTIHWCQKVLYMFLWFLGALCATLIAIKQTKKERRDLGWRKGTGCRS